MVLFTLIVLFVSQKGERHAETASRRRDGPSSGRGKVGRWGCRRRSREERGRVDRIAATTMTRVGAVIRAHWSLKAIGMIGRKVLDDGTAGRDAQHIHRAAELVTNHHSVVGGHVGQRVALGQSWPAHHVEHGVILRPRKRYMAVARPGCGLFSKVRPGTTTTGAARGQAVVGQAAVEVTGGGSRVVGRRPALRVFSSVSQRRTSGSYTQARRKLPRPSKR